MFCELEFHGLSLGFNINSYPSGAPPLRVRSPQSVSSSVLPQNSERHLGRGLLLRSIRELAALYIRTHPHPQSVWIFPPLPPPGSASLTVDLPQSFATAPRSLGMQMYELLEEYNTRS